jgi:hypothetical protein
MIQGIDGNGPKEGTKGDDSHADDHPKWEPVQAKRALGGTLHFVPGTLTPYHSSLYGDLIRIAMQAVNARAPFRPQSNLQS